VHGTIHKELRGYVVDTHGEDAYTAILARAGLAGKEYDPAGYYDDEEVFRIVAAAAQQLDMSEQEVLERYGIWVAPGLLQGFAAMIEPQWRTLDLVEHTEEIIHSWTRENMSAKPPVLRTERRDADHLIVDYRSHRRMCTLGTGFIVGIAAHYGEPVHVEQRTCMHRGDDRCTIDVHVRATVDGTAMTDAARAPGAPAA
jgi:hypothetical protein